MPLRAIINIQAKKTVTFILNFYNNYEKKFLIIQRSLGKDKILLKIEHITELRTLNEVWNLINLAL